MEPEDIHQEQSPFNAGDEQNTVPASLLTSVLSRLGLESGNRDAYPLPGTHEDELLTVLQTATWEARIAAVWELEKLGTQAPLEALRETARSDEDVSVRAAAVRVLASLGKYVLLPDEAFLTALHDPDWQVREASALALAGLAEQAPVEALLTTAQDKQEDALVRDAARLALEQLSDSMKVLPTYRQRKRRAWQYWFVARWNPFCL